MIRPCLALALVALPAFASAADDKPVVVFSEGGKFSVTMPEKPARKVQKVPTQVGDIEAHYFVVERNARGYLACYSDYPKGSVTEDNVQKVLDGAVDGCVKGLKGKLLSDEKAALARRHGCNHPIVYTRENFVERVKEITGGEGVPVVYDSIGKDTFIGSLDCLRPLGMMVNFGSASGPVTQINTADLVSRGSLFFTRPTLFSYTAKRADLEASANELFDVVARGDVKIEVNQRYALADVAQAHRDLEARKTTGSTLLMP